MMKKYIIILGLLLFAVCSATAQDKARIAEIEKQMKELGQDYFAGKITVEEYKRREAELQKEFISALDAGTDSRPVDGKRYEQLYDQYYTLTASHNAGKIGDAEYQAKAKPIADEIEALQGNGKPLSSANTAILVEAGKNIKKLWPGSTPGWPPTDGDNGTRTLCGLGTFSQSPGTRASWSFTRFTFNGPVNSITIYQTGGDTAAVFADIKRQIEAATGGAMRVVSNGVYRIWVQGPVEGSAGFNLNLSQRNGWVEFEITKQHE